MASPTGPSATRELLDIRHVGRLNPHGDGWLVRDVSLRVEPGDRVAILGPSGAGKTVLLRLIALLDSPDEGEIRFRGMPLADADVPSYRSQVIYLHQRAHLLEGTVEQNLRLPFRLHVHRHQEFDEGQVVRALDRLGRSKAFLSRSTSDLSGGEAQIVALLRAMQLNPLILLLDEPTASADTETTRTIEQLVIEWFEVDARRALICVTHRPEQVQRWCRRSLHLLDGRISGDPS